MTSYNFVDNKSVSSNNKREQLLNLIYQNKIENIILLRQFIHEQERLGINYIFSFDEMNTIILENIELFKMYFESNQQVSYIDELEEEEKVIVGFGSQLPISKEVKNDK